MEGPKMGFSVYFDRCSAVLPPKIESYPTFRWFPDFAYRIYAYSHTVTVIYLAISLGASLTYDEISGFGSKR